MVQGDGEPLDEWFAGFVEEVRRWHEFIIEQSGGAAGEHTARLISSVGRAFQSVFGEEAYPDDVEKAAALMQASSATTPSLMATSEPR